MLSLDTSLDLGSTSGTSLTVSYTNAGDILIVGAFSTGGDNITGITFNGVAMTKIGAAVQIPANTLNITLWYLKAPLKGTANIVISAASSTIGGGAASYKGNTPDVDVNGNTTATGTTSISKSITTIKDNAWTVAICSSDGFNVSAGANTTMRQSNGTNRALFDSNGAITPPGSTTLNVNMAGSGNSAIIMADIYDINNVVSNLARSFFL